MKIIKVALKEKSYEIIIGNNIFNSLGRALAKLHIGEEAIVITNPLVKRYFAEKIRKTLIKSGFTVQFQLVPDSEKSKSAPIAFGLIDKIARGDTKKRLFIIALGGGVIGDIAGFIAATYKRGIPYVQIPTTLLGQVDSAIGGKVGIDLNIGKNLAGAFYQPRLVFSDVATLRSLDIRQVRCGLAEVIKYGVIKNAELFKYTQNNIGKLLALHPACLEYIIYRCSLIKAHIVEQDEKETKGIRTILNFGHTIGHAIETAGRYKAYNHGEAIAIGMVCAAQISENLGLFSNQSFQQLEDIIIKSGLPVTARGLKLSRIINAYLHDKKFVSGKNRFVLPVKIGRVLIYEDVPFAIIKEVIDQRLA